MDPRMIEHFLLVTLLSRVMRCLDGASDLPARTKGTAGLSVIRENEAKMARETLFRPHMAPSVAMGHLPLLAAQQQRTRKERPRLLVCSSVLMN